MELAPEKSPRITVATEAPDAPDFSLQMDATTGSPLIGDFLIDAASNRCFVVAQRVWRLNGGETTLIIHLDEKPLKTRQ